MMAALRAALPLVRFFSAPATDATASDASPPPSSARGSLARPPGSAEGSAAETRCTPVERTTRFFGSGGFQPVFRERWLSASFSGAEAFSHWLQFCKNGFDRWSHLGSDSSEGGMNDRDSSGDSLPGLADSSGDSLPPRDSDDASSVESSADSFGAHVARAVWYMSSFQIEALVRLAFIRWRLLSTVQA